MFKTFRRRYRAFRFDHKYDHQLLFICLDVALVLLQLALVGAVCFALYLVIV